MLTVLLIALLAKPPAPDTAGPTIDHAPIATAAKGADLVITATIKDPGGVFGPTVYFRAKGDAKFSALELSGQGANAFGATIPGARLAKDLEYYVEAYDENGNGPSRVGDPDKPLVVTLEADKAPVKEEPKEEPASEETASADTDTKGEGGAYLPDSGVDADAPSDGGSSSELAPIITAGAGAVAFIAGIALYFSASSTVTSIDAKYAQVDEDYRKLRQPADADALRSAIGSSRVGSILMITGSLAAVGGGAWYLMPRLESGGGGELTLALDGRF